MFLEAFLLILDFATFLKAFYVYVMQTHYILKMELLEGAIFLPRMINELKRKTWCCYTCGTSGKYIEQISMFCPKAGKRLSDSQLSVNILYLRKTRCSKLVDRVISLLNI